MGKSDKKVHYREKRQGAIVECGVSSSLFPKTGLRGVKNQGKKGCEQTENETSNAFSTKKNRRKCARKLQNGGTMGESDGAGVLCSG